MVPTVVIVPGGDSYIEAIAQWTPQARFPVLIDDGSARAREDIARFVRAFKPPQVVRWERAGEAAATTRERIEGAVRAVWSAQLPGEPEAPARRLRRRCSNRWPYSSQRSSSTGLTEIWLSEPTPIAPPADR